MNQYFKIFDEKGNRVELPQITGNKFLVDLFKIGYSIKPTFEGIRAKTILKKDGQVISIVAWCLRYSEIADISISNMCSANRLMVDAIYCCRQNPNALKIEYQKNDLSKFPSKVWHLNSDNMDWEKFEKNTKKWLISKI